MIHLHLIESITMINGQTATKFFEIIEQAMDQAGGGKYRAFNLVTCLQEIGFKIEAIAPDEMPRPKPEPASETA